MAYPWHLYAMAFFYITAGILHFLKPNIYISIMPNYLPFRKFLVHLSGFIEIVLGISICFSKLHNIAIYGLITMLLVFLLVHYNIINMYNEEEATCPKWLFWIRIPIQFLLIFWAYSYID